MSAKTKKLQRKTYAKTIKAFAVTEIAHVLEKKLKQKNLVILIESIVLILLMASSILFSIGVIKWM